MTRKLQFAISASSAAIALATLTNITAAVAASETPFFDPILSDPASVCMPAGDTRKLMNFYQRVAAASETRPFRPPADAKSGADADAPLYTNLGKVSFKITTSSPMAQRYFDQGLRLAYGFNHAEAERAFRTARKHDPACAMCSWGEALVLGPNINAPMQDAAVAPAIAAVKRATEQAERNERARAGADRRTGEALFGRSEGRARRARCRIRECDERGGEALPGRP